MQRLFALMILPALGLAACGGGGGKDVLPVGVEIGAHGFETYTNQHDARNRVRKTLVSDPADLTILSEVDRGRGPSTYVNLIDLKGNAMSRKMTLEVIAEVHTVQGEGGETKVTQRLLRLSADQQPLVMANGDDEHAGGPYYFKGNTVAWVSIDGGPPLAGTHPKGLEYMKVDFSNEVISVNIRTDSTDEQPYRIEINETNMPFNVRSGAFGGVIEIDVNDGRTIETIAGDMRGSIGGTTGYNGASHALTTSGLYRGSNASADTPPAKKIEVEGIFWGQDERLN